MDRLCLYRRINHIYNEPYERANLSHGGPSSKILRLGQDLSQPILRPEPLEFKMSYLLPIGMDSMKSKENP